MRVNNALDLKKWECGILGPQGTIWANATYKLELLFPDGKLVSWRLARWMAVVVVVVTLLPTSLSLGMKMNAHALVMITIDANDLCSSCVAQNTPRNHLNVRRRHRRKANSFILVPPIGHVYPFSSHRLTNHNALPRAQANSSHHSSTPTYTRPARCACRSSTKTKAGGRRSRSSRS